MADPRLRVKVKVEGLDALRAEMARLGRQYPKGLGAALYRLGVQILSTALPLTPVEFGVLRSSGYVSPPEGTGPRTNVEVGFGTQYAVFQHEGLHLRHPRGGQAKFLSEAVNRSIPGALPNLKRWAEQFQDGWAQQGGVPTRPRVSSTTVRKASQKRRFARAARNVRKKTGR